MYNNSDSILIIWEKNVLAKNTFYFFLKNYSRVTYAVFDLIDSISVMKIKLPWSHKDKGHSDKERVQFHSVILG